jgi:hypothetical protein
MIDARRSKTVEHIGSPQGLPPHSQSMPAAQQSGRTYLHDRTQARRPDPIGKTCLRIAPKTFACLTYPAQTAAGRRWFARLETPGLPNMLPLHDVKHPRPPKGHREFQFTGQQTPQGQGSGRIDPQKRGSRTKGPGGARRARRRHRKNLKTLRHRKGPGGARRVRRRHRKNLETLRHRKGPGGARRVRTDDLKLAKLPLSQLSYGPI